MTQYTATEVRELVAELPVLKMEAGAEPPEVEALRDALEGADQLLRELPEEERAEALVDDSLLVGRALWVPVVQNCPCRQDSRSRPRTVSPSPSRVMETNSSSTSPPGRP